MRLCLRYCARILTLAALLSAPAAARAYANVPPAGMRAATLDEVVEHWSELNELQQIAALDQIIGLGEIDIAGRLLNSSRFTGLYVGDAGAMRAAIMNAQGHPQEAAEVAEAVLRQMPKHRRARLELARAKFLVADDASAREQFALALDGADPSVQRAVQTFIEAMDRRRALHAASTNEQSPAPSVKPWAIQVTSGVTGSTNVTQGTDTRIVYLNGLPFRLNDDATSKAGGSVWSAVNAGYLTPISDGLSFGATFGATGKRVTERIFDDSALTVAVGPRWSIDRAGLPTEVALSLTGGYRWVADEAYSGTIGGRLSATTHLSSADLLSTSLAVDGKFFSDDWQANDLSYQDSVVVSLDAAVDHFFAPSTFARVLGTVAEEASDTRTLSYDLWSIGIGYGAPIVLGATVYAQLSYTALRFDGISPGTNDARHDERLDASLAFTNEQWAIWGSIPTLAYTYTANQSNVPFYDFDSHQLTLSVTRGF